MSKGESPPWSPSLTFHRELAALGFHPKTSCASYRNTCAGEGRGGWGWSSVQPAQLHGVRGTGPAQAPQQRVPPALPDPAGSTP